MKSRRVYIKTRSPPASLLLKGQVTKHTTVKWTIRVLQHVTRFVRFHALMRSTIQYLYFWTCVPC